MQKRRRYITAYKREKRPRINEQIRAPRVLLVDGEDAEEMTPEEAIVRAKEQELDLIEVSPKAKPPVVKIGDFGQYLYQIKKKERKQRSHSKPTEVKTLRMSFRTDTHDIDRLKERAQEFMGERHLVKFVIQLRGRELTNKAYAKEKLLGVVKDLANVSEVEQEIKPQGNQFIVILRPKRGGKKIED
ncbi:MAG: translation initiation factor IF-3 [Euryarchaeota archaeon]|nr:translation initiation factor IF-3 [Euryarchaeota archaeon]MDP6575184.1 translation initiation factor IF-3 [Candidatus Peribacteraceae bacterium]HCI03295.1 translation initiation factor IF-3 [Candidatus Peribacteria bacterium]|tara:strand:- start:1575 stop:2135 length:561 start_codon:yes stop_codon:yes gene_type:complete